jgi:hypothetical protein
VDGADKDEAMGATRQATGYAWALRCKGVGVMRHRERTWRQRGGCGGV